MSAVAFLSSCIKEPLAPVVENITAGKEGAFILNEGLWGMNNSSLSRINMPDYSVEEDLFKKANKGFNLGDLANDIFQIKDTVFLALTGSKAIYKINLHTGILTDSLILKGNYAPRKLFISENGRAFFTDLYRHSIVEFNSFAMKLKNEIPVGPAPEGLVNYGIYLFCANSGYGDYLANKPKAGTISVIDMLSGNEISNIPGGPNVVELIINKKYNSLFAVYKNLPSKKNETGGIIQFDLTDLSQKKLWITQAKSICFSESLDTLFFLNKNGIGLIDFSAGQTEIRQCIINPNPSENWYCLSYRTDSKTLWIGNARNYQIKGEVLIYSLQNPSYPYRKIPTGVNPNSIFFN